MSFSNEHSWGEYFCTLCKSYIAVSEIGDWYIPFGCKDESDPSMGAKDKEYICKSCMPLYKKNWKEKLELEHKSGDYVKSRTEAKVARSLKLKWIGSEGLGVRDYKTSDNWMGLNSENYKPPYQYVPKVFYKKLKVLEQLLKHVK